ncbi:MAG: CrcB family protein [SAR202 cluster bacterium]|nr:CrcB family protein [SAR202 cluster bacterium]
MSEWFLVAAGGALGTMARHGLTRYAASSWGSPTLGTFVINVAGSFVLGILMGVLSQRTTVGPEVRWLLAVGFLGGFTTFSTLTAASAQLALDGDIPRAALNVGGSIAAGLAAAFAGLLLGRAV